MSIYDMPGPPEFLQVCRNCGLLISDHRPLGPAQYCPWVCAWPRMLSRPRYRPNYDRVLRAYLTHRRSTHYDYRINFDRRIRWDDRKLYVDCPACIMMERQLAQAEAGP